MANGIKPTPGLTDDERQQVFLAGRQGGISASKARRAAGISEANVPQPIPADRTSRRSGSTTTDTNDRVSRRTTEGPQGPDFGMDIEQPDRDDIFAAARARAQSLIDTINTQFNRAVASTQEQGERAEQRTRALNVSGGLQGSDFATAAAMETEAETQEELRRLEQERAAQINEVLTSTQERASEEFRQERELFLDETRARREERRDFIERQKERAINEVSQVAASGIGFEDFKLEHPEEYEQLLEDFEGNEAALKGTFIDAVPEKERLGSVQTDGKAIFFYQDPVTGEKSKVEFDIPQASSEKSGGYKTVKAGTDVLLIPENPDPDIPITDQIVRLGGGSEAGSAAGEGGVGGSVFVTPDGEEIDVSRNEGIERLRELEFSRGEIQAFLDENTSLNQGTINRRLDEVFGESDQIIDRDWIQNQFSQEQLEEIAKDEGFTKRVSRPGLFGIGEVTDSEPDVDAYIESFLSGVEARRQQGMTDEEILEEMQTPNE